MQQAFENIARLSGLSSEERDGFLESVSAPDRAGSLKLDRAPYNRLQREVERAVYLALHQVGGQDFARGPLHAPLVYSTAKPLTPLRIYHERRHILQRLLNSGAVVSVMSTHGICDFVNTADSFERTNFLVEVLSLLGNSSMDGSFSVSLPSDSEPAEGFCAANLRVLGEGENVFLAFKALQAPSKDPGELLFGLTASALFDHIRRTHLDNLAEGRDTQFVSNLFHCRP